MCFLRCCCSLLDPLSCTMWSIYMLESNCGKTHLLHLLMIIKTLLLIPCNPNTSHISLLFLAAVSSIWCHILQNALLITFPFSDNLIFAMNIYRRFTTILLIWKAKTVDLLTNRADFQSTEPSQLCQSLMSLSILTHVNTTPLKPRVAPPNPCSEIIGQCEFLNTTEGNKGTHSFLPANLCRRATAAILPKSI